MMVLNSNLAAVSRRHPGIGEYSLFPRTFSEWWHTTILHNAVMLCIWPTLKTAEGTAEEASDDEILDKFLFIFKCCSAHNFFIALLS